MKRWKKRTTDREKVWKEENIRKKAIKLKNSFPERERLMS